MPWIEVIPLESATGFLKKQYDAAIKRAGRIWNIVSIMSQNPRVQNASMDFYGAIMYGRSPLSRGQREMLAVVVSVHNECLYWLRSHAYDLRAEVADFDIQDEQAADLFVHHIASDWRQADLSLADKALCQYAEKLTQSPHLMTEIDVQTLRAHGVDDRAIHDATQVISYFNYINRVADALGVAPEKFIRPWEQSPLPFSAE